MNRYAVLLELIANRRAELRMSERAACEASGLKPDAVRTIRRGNAPKPETLAKLAAGLKLPASVLLDAAANVESPPSSGDQSEEESALDREFARLLSRMDDSTKLKTLEIMEIMLRPDDEEGAP